MIYIHLYPSESQCPEHCPLPPPPTRNPVAESAHAQTQISSYIADNLTVVLYHERH